MTPLFGVSEFTTWPWNFERDMEQYAALGVGAIEICEFKLHEMRAAEQLALPAQYGLTVSSVQPRLHSLFSDAPRPTPRSPVKRMEFFRQTIDRFGEAIPGTTLVTITGAAPHGNYRRAFEIAVEQYSELAAYAGRHDVRIALEPLNPILMNADTFVCTIEGAMEIVNAVNSPHFGIFIDTWHVWPDADAARRIRECGAKIFGIHINDWHRPRCFGDRVSLGQGNIDLVPLLKACHESGYDGAYTLEIFSEECLPDSLWKTDLAQLITVNKAAFERLWQEALCS